MSFLGKPAVPRYRATPIPLQPTLHDAVYALGLALPRRGREAFAREKLALPYGRWTCADGRQVLFNRKYRPIWQRRPGGAVERANPAERVPWIAQGWFYQDGRTPWRSRPLAQTLLALLADFGVPIGGRP